MYLLDLDAGKCLNKCEVLLDPHIYGPLIFQS